MNINYLKNCLIKDVNKMQGNTAPVLTDGNFENGDRCVVLGFTGMEDGIVIVSARTGLTFEVWNFEDAVDMDY